MAGQQGANLADHEIKGQLEHELRVHPAQRRVSLELPVGFELLAVETKMTTDQLGLVWQQGINVGPAAWQAVALDHREEENGRAVTGGSNAVALVQMGHPEPGAGLGRHHRPA